MKKIVVSILVLLCIGLVYGFYLYNKKTPSLENEKPDYTLTADELYTSFSTDEASAMEKYEGKILQVSGKVLMLTQTDSISNVVLNAEDALFGSVNCSFSTLKETLQKKENIVVKGQCQGYLTNVILNNCVLVK
jgi:hypothetical protein